jgi:hypothetical protein
VNSELTVGELKWILLAADDDATLAEARRQLADVKRREAADLEHAARQRLYHQYLERRQEREHAAVQSAYSEAKQAALRTGPISRESLHVVAMEAADLERLRFEIREPRLAWEDWLDAGKPDVHRIKGAEHLPAAGRNAS